MARWSFQGQLSFSWTQCFWVSGSLLGEFNIFRLQVCGLPGTSGLDMCWDLPTVPPVSWRGLNQWEILLSLDLSEEWINQILTRLDYGSGRFSFICLDLVLLWTLDWMVANCIIWLEWYVVCNIGKVERRCVFWCHSSSGVPILWKPWAVSGINSGDLWTMNIKQIYIEHNCDNIGIEFQ